MDHEQLIVLETEIQAQLATIERVYSSLEERTHHLKKGSSLTIESVAYQLHNPYSAIEDLLQIVASAFENHLTDRAKWHSQLLNRMGLIIPGVRPALLSAATIQKLHALRSFRHFFRHAYGVPLDFHKIQENIQTALEIRPMLSHDVHTFLYTLGSQDSDV